MEFIKVGIVGGAGYTAGELIRILIGHPLSEIKWVVSGSHAGQHITKVHTDLIGDTSLTFSENPDFKIIDILFLCTGHGNSAAFINKYPVPENVKIIDLSNDFRLVKPGNDFVYGLPELNRDKILSASKIANPGCFATAIQLALLPLALNNILTETHVHAITGSTGAGQTHSPTTHFSWRNDNVSLYKQFEHQHMDEIMQSLKQVMPQFNEPINFVPMRGNFSRGILASVYLDCNLSLSEARNIFEDYYKSHPFVFLSDNPVDLKQVVNTNKCLLELGVYRKKLHITSIIDNLTKGASGQAVQNMNLLFGIEETTGLYLKPSAF